MAVAYGLTVDGMLRADIGRLLMLPVLACYSVVGLAMLTWPDRTQWLIAPALFSGYPVWIAAGHAVHHPELLLTSIYLIFVLGSLAAVGSTRWFVLAVLVTLPALTIGLWDQYPTRYALAFRVIGDGVNLMMISSLAFHLSRRQERLAQRLHDLAGADPLTRLPNRRRLDQEASRFVRAAQDGGALFAVLIFDLDHFKQVNDRHGHAMGDQVLIAVTQDVAGMLGPEALLARTGGEELLVLTVVTDATQAQALGARVRALVAEGSSPVPVTCSMGVAAVAPPSGRMTSEDAAAWLWAVAAVADLAMYDAKQGGRDRVVLAPCTTVPRPTRPAVRPHSSTPRPAPLDPIARVLAWWRQVRQAALPTRSPPAGDAATRLLGLRLAGGMAINCVGLLVLVEHWHAMLAPGRLPRAIFLGIVLHGLGIGLTAALRPQALRRFAPLGLVVGCVSWGVAPLMYRDPALFVTPTQLLLICGIAALVTSTRSFALVLLIAMPSLWVVLSHNDYPPSVLPGQVVLNGGCVLAACIGLHLLRVRNERVQQRLQLLAVTDPLTRLPNRRHVQDSAPAVVRRALGEGRQVAVLLIDLDRFKDVNDRHGHAIGDEILIAVPAAILACLGPGELLARAGGEEFLVLTVVADLDTASDLAEQVRRAVEQLPGPVPVTCSIGVAAATPDAAQAVAAPAEWVWSLTADADRAMYQAKLSGRNRVVALAPDQPAPAPRADGVPRPGEQTRRTMGVRAVHPGGTVG
ncbi:MAG: GGDEF domain-containing protein [Kineosporiaceae bacterium]